MENWACRALLVDDEPLCRRHLRQLLKVYPEIKIVGEAGSVAEAEILSERNRPNVIFLDVQMPWRDGFSLLPKLRDKTHVVLVTSHDHYALRGFEVDALDYLRKPVMPDRFDLTIRRLRAVLGSGQTAPQPPALDDVIVVGDAEDCRTTSPGAVAAICAEGNYSRLYLVGSAASTLMLRGLAEWERLMPAPPFCRVDRSLIVNLAHVHKFEAESRNQSLLQMKGTNETFRLGRTASTRLRTALRDFVRP